MRPSSAAPAEEKDAGRGRLRRGVFCAAVAAFAIKLALAVLTVGTADSLTWAHDLDKLRSQGFADLYREGVRYQSPNGVPYVQQFIHPPAMVHGLRVGGALQYASGLPVRFWLRLACALADAGTLILLWQMFSGGGRALIWMALSPISLLISGFHTNTDPIMMFLLVACVYLTGRKRILLAGVAFGLAASVKLVPVILVPTILLSLEDWSERGKWACMAAAAWLATSLPFLAQEPVLILSTILKYESNRGLWGLYMLSGMLSDTPLGFVNDLYAPASKWVALAGAALAPVIPRLLQRPLPLFAQCGLTVSVFLALSPGFGLQYLTWMVPWLLAAGEGPMAGYFATAGTCMLFLYSRASAGTGVHAYADLIRLGAAVLAPVELVLWVATASMAYLYGRLAAGGPRQ